MKYNLQEHIGKQIEVFTKLRDEDEYYSKSSHKGTICKVGDKFYCQSYIYRFPLYENNDCEVFFGINTKYVITL